MDGARESAHRPSSHAVLTEALRKYRSRGIAGNGAYGYSMDRSAGCKAGEACVSVEGCRRGPLFVRTDYGIRTHPIDHAGDADTKSGTSK
jgi:hypothetical protein